MGIEKHPVFDDINILLKSLGYFLINPVFKNDTEAARYLMNAPYDAQMIEDLHKVKDFEKAFSKYVGAKYAVALSSGTAALHLGALSMGLGDRDASIAMTLQEERSGIHISTRFSEK